MSDRELSLYWVILTLEALLCLLVYGRGLYRRLPFFAAYSTTLLVCSLELGATYSVCGYRSSLTYYSAWATVEIDLLVRCLAIAELCRYQFRNYRGIWALGWRFLTGLGALFLVHAAWDTWGQLHRLAIFGLTLERDFDIASIVLLCSMLAIRGYYGLALETLQKAVVIGMCFICAIDVINNTGLQAAFNGYLASWFHTASSPMWAAIRAQVDQANEWWNTVRFSAFVVSLGAWCYALRKPLPAPMKGPVLLPVEVYGELSPAVNLRLRAFNDRLTELLRP